MHLSIIYLAASYKSRVLRNSDCVTRGNSSSLIFSVKDILYSWAGGTNIAYYMIFGLCGINFIIEDSENNVFGCYTTTKVDKYSWIINKQHFWKNICL